MKNVKIPVIMYHGFAEAIRSDDPFDNQYITTAERFEENIRTLLNRDYTSIPFERLYRAKTASLPQLFYRLPKKPLIVTFDDGLMGQYTVAYPIIRKYGLYTTMFVTTDFVGEKNYFGWDAAREMQSSGLVSISSHGKRHIPYNSVSIDELTADISESFEVIDSGMGASRLKIFAYPFGMYSDETIAALSQTGVGIQCCGLGMNRLDTLDLSCIRRINIPYKLTGGEIADIIDSL
jgi:peptidoglycan/xylan/chitin deacetylase (PgdA/CDA1 family)